MRDQVDALRRTGGAEMEVFAFAPGGARAYIGAAAELRRRYGRRRFDIVHAHFGLSQWPALAARARARLVTLHGTDLAHPRSRPISLPGCGSSTSSAPCRRRWRRRSRAGPSTAGRIAVLPCGVDLHRFRPIPRAEAREALGLDPAGPYLLFPSDPARPEKRHDLARQVAGRGAAC